MKRRKGFSDSTNVFLVSIKDIIELNNDFMKINNHFLAKKGKVNKYKLSREDINKIYEKSIVKVK